MTTVQWLERGSRAIDDGLTTKIEDVRKDIQQYDKRSVQVLSLNDTVVILFGRTV